MYIIRFRKTGGKWRVVYELEPYELLHYRFGVMNYIQYMFVDPFVHFFRFKHL